MPKHFIADAVSTKDGLHRRMLFIDNESGALEIFGPKLCYFSTIKNSVSRGSGLTGLKRQCPLRPSEIENMWHIMKTQNSPFFAQRYRMVALETWWHFLLRKCF